MGTRHAADRSGACRTRRRTVRLAISPSVSALFHRPRIFRCQDHTAFGARRHKAAYTGTAPHCRPACSAPRRKAGLSAFNRPPSSWLDRDRETDGGGARHVCSTPPPIRVATRASGGSAAHYETPLLLCPLSAILLRRQDDAWSPPPQPPRPNPPPRGSQVAAGCTTRPSRGINCRWGTTGASPAPKRGARGRCLKEWEPRDDRSREGEAMKQRCGYVWIRVGLGRPLRLAIRIRIRT